MRVFWSLILAVGLGLCAARASAAPQSISETRQNHGSLQNQWIDSVGGIVTFKSTLGTRVLLQDPSSSEYAAIQIRDLNSVQNDTGGYVWSRVNVGDWVSFQNVRVTEWTGNTMLRFNDPDRPNNSFPLSTLTVLSTGNPLPPPVVVSLDEILAPEFDEYYHIASGSLASYQKLEGMQIAVRNVEVTSLDVGRFADNYELRAPGDVAGTGPSAYAADYNNYNRQSTNAYHALTAPGAQFPYITGYLERSKASSTPDDYYQLVTTESASFGLHRGDYDFDGDVDGDDLLAWQRTPELLTEGLEDWSENFGATPPSTAAVPEPGQVWLLGFLVLFGTRPRAR